MRKLILGVGLLTATTAYSQVYVMPFCERPQAGYEHMAVDDFLKDQKIQHGDGYKIIRGPENTVIKGKVAARNYVAEVTVAGELMPIFVTSSSSYCKIMTKKMFGISK